MSNWKVLVQVIPVSTIHAHLRQSYQILVTYRLGTYIQETLAVITKDPSWLGVWSWL